MGPTNWQLGTIRGAMFQLEPLEQRRMLSGGIAEKTAYQSRDRGVIAEWLYTLPNGGFVRFEVYVENNTVTESGRAPVESHSLTVSLQDFGLANDADEFDAQGSTDQFQEIDGPDFKSVGLHAIVLMRDATNGVAFPLVIDLDCKIRGPWTVVNEKAHRADGDTRFQGKYSDATQVTGTAIAPEGDGDLIAPGMNMVQGNVASGTIFQDTLIITYRAANPKGNGVLGAAAPVLA